MSVTTGPNEVVSGLLLSLDTGNTKSYKINLANYSTYNASNWTNGFPAGATLTTGIDDPFGGTSAIRFACTNTTNALLRVTFTSFTPSGTDAYVVSFYARKVSGTSGSLTCDLTDLTPSGDYTSQLVTGQWIRIQVTATPVASARNFFDLLSDSTNNYTVDYYGLQIETGTTATPYVGTNGSALPINTAYDISNNGNNATAQTGAYSYTGKGSISLNGSNQYISITKPYPNISGLISLDMWIYLNSISTQPVIIHKGGHYTLQIYSTDTYSYADQSNYSYANYGARTALGIGTTGVWKHIVVTKDSSNIVRIYINGVLADTSPAFGGSIAQVTSTLWIGGYSDTDTVPSVNMINGYIGPYKIYNATLTGEQVLQNFNALRGRFGL